MSYIEKWNALSTRIRGLERATQLAVQSSIGELHKDTRKSEYLSGQGDSIIKEVDTFFANFSDIIDRNTSNCYAVFKDELSTTLILSKVNALNTYEKIVRLLAFDSEITFLLSDTQEHIRSRAEIAFAHLQSLIQVDDRSREEWRTAFNEGETRCEARGKVHFLWHGILAFKVDGAGGRTDLVYPDPPNETWQKSAIGLVLTEWKKADANGAARAFDDAEVQLKRYCDGPLAGIELAGYRYAIVVTEKSVTIPIDRNESGITYRHINIVVNPDMPALDARKTVARQRREVRSQ